MNAADIATLEELESNLTPTKMNRYVQLNQEKQLSYEQEKEKIIEELALEKAKNIELEAELEFERNDHAKYVELMTLHFEDCKKQFEEDINQKNKQMMKLRKDIAVLQQEIAQFHLPSTSVMPEGMEQTKNQKAKWAIVAKYL